LDAYADDMMPIHLMTTEALAMYTKLLKPGGVMAVHISSRYLALRPVLETSAARLGLAFRHHFESEPAAPYTVPSEWVLLVATEADFAHGEFADMKLPIMDEEVLWTDSYSSLVPVVRWR
jgi:spermidine synthase